VLEGDSYEEASALASRIEADEGRILVPPYDDLDVIAGQGTVAMEILRQHRAAIDAIFAGEDIGRADDRCQSFDDVIRHSSAS